jgi:CHAT domain-containing protein
MSVIVAPGFLSFANPPRPAREKYHDALVVGAPERQGLQSLPGARVEAQNTADILKTKAYVSDEARKITVQRELMQRAKSLDFILFATHGRASARNPVDGSYLEFSDARLDAREIALQFAEPTPGKTTEPKSGWLRNRPVVVMSACETGLGKDFAVGTIGLARAWHWAGASNVVMSLWGVDDLAASNLMINFVHKLDKGVPVDMALRKVADDARRLDDNPAKWAAFNVFGVPEKIRVK